MLHYLYHLSYFIFFIHLNLILQFIFLLNVLIIISNYKSNLFNYVNLLKSYNKYKYLIILFYIFYIIFKFLIHFLLLIISILIIIHLFYNIKYLIYFSSLY